MTPPRRTYTPPRSVDAVALYDRATRRRAALVAGGCATYEVGQRNGQPAIACLCCGLGSFHPADIEQKYCGFCGTFHNEWSEEPS